MKTGYLATTVASHLYLACAVAQAQEFPSTTIRFIVSANPGVPSDTLPRGMLDSLRRALGQPVVIENRVGADGLIAAEACMKAPADGHTICQSGNTMMTLNPLMRSNLPYDPVRDFAGVMHIGFFDSLLMVPASLPANTISQLLELARSKPESLVWASFGRTTTGYLYGEWLKKDRGVPFYSVPYKTQAQALQALLVSDAQVAIFAWPNMLAQIRSGKLKALAVTAAARLPVLPDVPTFEAEGIKLPLRTWFGFHVPAATPRPVVLRLNTEFRKVMADPAYRSGILAREGITPNDGTPGEFDAFVQDQLRQTGVLFRSLGIKPLAD